MALDRHEHEPYVFVGRQPGRWHVGEAPIRPVTHLSPTAALRRFKLLVEEAGLHGVDGESITWHTLRHSFAYLARVRDKLSERTIMKRGGWRTRSAFDRYGIGDEGELAEMYQAVDARIARDTERLKGESE